MPSPDAMGVGIYLESIFYSIKRDSKFFSSSSGSPVSPGYSPLPVWSKDLDWDQFTINILTLYFSHGFPLDYQRPTSIFEGGSVLMLATRYKRIAVVEWLLQHGADASAIHSLFDTHNALTYVFSPADQTYDGQTMSLLTTFLSQGTPILSSAYTQFFHAVLDIELTKGYMDLWQLLWATDPYAIDIKSMSVFLSRKERFFPDIFLQKRAGFSSSTTLPTQPVMIAYDTLSGDQRKQLSFMYVIINDVYGDGLTSEFEEVLNQTLYLAITACLTATNINNSFLSYLLKLSNPHVLNNLYNPTLHPVFADQSFPTGWAQTPLVDSWFQRGHRHYDNQRLHPFIRESSHVIADYEKFQRADPIGDSKARNDLQPRSFSHLRHPSSHTFPSLFHVLFHHHAASLDYNLLIAIELLISAKVIFTIDDPTTFSALNLLSLHPTLTSRIGRHIALKEITYETLLTSSTLPNLQEFQTFFAEPLIKQPTADVSLTSAENSTAPDLDSTDINSTLSSSQVAPLDIFTLTSERDLALLRIVSEDVLTDLCIQLFLQIFTATRGLERYDQFRSQFITHQVFTNPSLPIDVSLYFIRYFAHRFYFSRNGLFFKEQLSPAEQFLHFDASDVLEMDTTFGYKTSDPNSLLETNSYYLTVPLLHRSVMNTQLMKSLVPEYMSELNRLVPIAVSETSIDSFTDNHTTYTFLLLILGLQRGFHLMSFSAGVKVIAFFYTELHIGMLPIESLNAWIALLAHNQFTTSFGTQFEQRYLQFVLATRHLKSIEFLLKQSELNHAVATTPQTELRTRQLTILSQQGIEGLDALYTKPQVAARLMSATTTAQAVSIMQQGGANFDLSLFPMAASRRISPWFISTVFLDGALQNAMHSPFMSNLQFIHLATLMYDHTVLYPRFAAFTLVGTVHDVINHHKWTLESSQAPVDALTPSFSHSTTEFDPLYMLLNSVGTESVYCWNPHQLAMRTLICGAWVNTRTIVPTHYHRSTTSSGSGGGNSSTTLESGGEDNPFLTFLLPGAPGQWTRPTYQQTSVVFRLWMLVRYFERYMYQLYEHQLVLHSNSMHSFVETGPTNPSDLQSSRASSQRGLCTQSVPAVTSFTVDDCDLFLRQRDENLDGKASPDINTLSTVTAINQLVFYNKPSRSSLQRETSTVLVPVIDEHWLDETSWFNLSGLFSAPERVSELAVLLTPSKMLNPLKEMKLTSPPALSDDFVTGFSLFNIYNNRSIYPVQLPWGTLFTLLTSVQGGQHDTSAAQVFAYLQLAMMKQTRYLAQFSHLLSWSMNENSFVTESLVQSIGLTAGQATFDVARTTNPALKAICKSALVQKTELVKSQNLHNPAVSCRRCLVSLTELGEQSWFSSIISSWFPASSTRAVQPHLLDLDPLLQVQYMVPFNAMLSLPYGFSLDSVANLFDPTSDWLNSALFSFPSMKSSSKRAIRDSKSSQPRKVAQTLAPGMPTNGALPSGSKTEHPADMSVGFFVSLEFQRSRWPSYLQPIKPFLTRPSLDFTTYKYTTLNSSSTVWADSRDPECFSYPVLITPFAQDFIHLLWMPSLSYNHFRAESFGLRIAYMLHSLALTWKRVQIDYLNVTGKHNKEFSRFTAIGTVLVELGFLPAFVWHQIFFLIILGFTPSNLVSHTHLLLYAIKLYLAQYSWSLPLVSTVRTSSTNAHRDPTQLYVLQAPGEIIINAFHLIIPHACSTLFRHGQMLPLFRQEKTPILPGKMTAVRDSGDRINSFAFFSLEVIRIHPVFAKFFRLVYVNEPTYHLSPSLPFRDPNVLPMDPYFNEGIYTLASKSPIFTHSDVSDPQLFASRTSSIINSPNGSILTDNPRITANREFLKAKLTQFSSLLHVPIKVYISHIFHLVMFDFLMIQGVTEMETINVQYVDHINYLLAARYHSAALGLGQYRLQNAAAGKASAVDGGEFGSVSVDEHFNSPFVRKPVQLQTMHVDRSSHSHSVQYTGVGLHLHWNVGEYRKEFFNPSTSCQSQTDTEQFLRQIPVEIGPLCSPPAMGTVALLAPPQYDPVTAAPVAPASIHSSLCTIALDTASLITRAFGSGSAEVNALTTAHSAAITMHSILYKGDFSSLEGWAPAMVSSWTKVEVEASTPSSATSAQSTPLTTPLQSGLASPVPSTLLADGQLTEDLSDIQKPAVLQPVPIELTLSSSVTRHREADTATQLSLVESEFTLIDGAEAPETAPLLELPAGVAPDGAEAAPSGITSLPWLEPFTKCPEFLQLTDYEYQYFDPYRPSVVRILNRVIGYIEEDVVLHAANLAKTQKAAVRAAEEAKPVAPKTTTAVTGKPSVTSGITVKRNQFKSVSKTAIIKPVKASTVSDLTDMTNFVINTPTAPLELFGATSFHYLNTGCGYHSSIELALAMPYHRSAYAGLRPMQIFNTKKWNKDLFAFVVECVDKKIIPIDMYTTELFQIPINGDMIATSANSALPSLSVEHKRAQYARIFPTAYESSHTWYGHASAGLTLPGMMLRSFSRHLARGKDFNKRAYLPDFYLNELPWLVGAGFPYPYLSELASDVIYPTSKPFGAGSNHPLDALIESGSGPSSQDARSRLAIALPQNSSIPFRYLSKATTPSDEHFFTTKYALDLMLALGRRVDQYASKAGNRTQMYKQPSAFRHSWKHVLDSFIYNSIASTANYLTTSSLSWAELHVISVVLPKIPYSQMTSMYMLFPFTVMRQQVHTRLFQRLFELFALHPGPDAQDVFESRSLLEWFFSSQFHPALEFDQRPQTSLIAGATEAATSITPESIYDVCLAQDRNEPESKSRSIEIFYTSEEYLNLDSPQSYSLARLENFKGTQKETLMQRMLAQASPYPLFKSITPIDISLMVSLLGMGFTPCLRTTAVSIYLEQCGGLFDCVLDVLHPFQPADSVPPPTPVMDFLSGASTGSADSWTVGNPTDNSGQISPIEQQALDGLGETSAASGGALSDSVIVIVDDFDQFLVLSDSDDDVVTPRQTKFVPDEQITTVVSSTADQASSPAHADIVDLTTSAAATGSLAKATSATAALINTVSTVEAQLARMFHSVYISPQCYPQYSEANVPVESVMSKYRNEREQSGKSFLDRTDVAAVPAHNAAPTIAEFASMLAFYVTIAFPPTMICHNLTTDYDQETDSYKFSYITPPSVTTGFESSGIIAGSGTSSSLMSSIITSTLSETYHAFPFCNKFWSITHALLSHSSKNLVEHIFGPQYASIIARLDPDTLHKLYRCDLITFIQQYRFHLFFDPIQTELLGLLAQSNQDSMHLSVRKMSTSHETSQFNLQINLAYYDRHINANYIRRRFNIDEDGEYNDSTLPVNPVSINTAGYAGRNVMSPHAPTSQVNPEPSSDQAIQTVPVEPVEAAPSDTEALMAKLMSSLDNTISPVAKSDVVSSDGEASSSDSESSVQGSEHGSEHGSDKDSDLEPTTEEQQPSSNAPATEPESTTTSPEPSAVNPKSTETSSTPDVNSASVEPAVAVDMKDPVVVDVNAEDHTAPSDSVTAETAPADSVVTAVADTDADTGDVTFSPCSSTYSATLDAVPDDDAEKASGIIPVDVPFVQPTGLPLTQVSLIWYILNNVSHVSIDDLTVLFQGIPNPLYDATVSHADGLDSDITAIRCSPDYVSPPSQYTKMPKYLIAPIDFNIVNDQQQSVLMFAILRRWKENTLTFLINALGIESVFSHYDICGRNAFYYIIQTQLRLHAPQLYEYVIEQYRTTYSHYPPLYKP